MSDFRIFHILERLNGVYLVYLVASLDLGQLFSIQDMSISAKKCKYTL